MTRPAPSGGICSSPVARNRSHTPKTMWARNCKKHQTRFRRVGRPIDSRENSYAGTILAIGGRNGQPWLEASTERVEKSGEIGLRGSIFTEIARKIQRISGVRGLFFLFFRLGHWLLWKKTMQGWSPGLCAYFSPISVSECRVHSFTGEREGGAELLMLLFCCLESLRKATFEITGIVQLH